MTFYLLKVLNREKIHFKVWFIFENIFQLCHEAHFQANAIQVKCRQFQMKQLLNPKVALLGDALFLQTSATGI